MHANTLTGNLDPSLDYIMETDPDIGGNRSLETYYGISVRGSRYLVGRNKNLPTGYKNINGDIVQESDNKTLMGFVPRPPDRLGYKLMGGQVYISKNAIRGYFRGDAFCRQIIIHEMDHLRDYYSGEFITAQVYFQDLGYTSPALEGVMSDWMEYRTYSKNLSRDPSNGHYFQMMLDHSKTIDWEMYYYGD